MKDTKLQIYADPKKLYPQFFGETVPVSGSVGIEVPQDGLLYSSPGFPGGPASDLRILGVAGDAAACGYFRIVYPLMVLASLGAKVQAVVVTKDAPITVDAFANANVILLQRAIEGTVLRNIQAVSDILGATLVYDLDDFLHGVSPKSPAYRLYNARTAGGVTVLDTINEFLKNMHGVIFSTRELAAAYRLRAPHAHVSMNGLDHALGHRDWDLEKPRYDWRSLSEEFGGKPDSDSLLFGWSGGSTHQGDLQVLGDSVKEILQKTKNTFFGICTSADLAHLFCIQHWRLPLDRVVFLPPTQFKDYPRVLSAFDLALTPLENTLFNQAKSSLRVLEFGAWGVPYVASKVAPFQRFHRESQGQGGAIVRNPQEFTEETIKMLRDSDLRKERSQFLQTYVRDVHDIRNTTKTLAHTLQAFRSGHKGGPIVRSFQTLEDEAAKIPVMRYPVPSASVCPCGSGNRYYSCCSPAFGKV